MLEQVLPIGTIVLLKGGIKRLMILGYQRSDSENLKRVYDYVGCTYPEGFISAENMILFDHSQIDHIYTFGLQNDEQLQFRKELEEQLDKLNLRK